MAERKPGQGREETEPDPYWTDDVALTETLVERTVQTVRLRVHQAEEAFRDHKELFPLQQTRGTRTYVHAQPYLLVPDLTVTVDLFPTPDAEGAIGRVTDRAWTGLRHQQIGQAQAWYYPADTTLVLWECFLFSFARRHEDPRQDATLIDIWTGFERYVLERFPQTSRLVTTATDPEYPDVAAYQRFLTQRGYQPFTAAAVVKPVVPPTRP